jgi:YegS/Rv2252/BmrU family lipid kinase
MKKTLLIINPCSGKKRIKNDLFSVVQLLGASGRNVCVAITERRGHAIELAKGADGYDEIICAGGDGTLNEVVTGLLTSGRNIPVGYLPSGSTNDFAKSLKLSVNTVKATKDIIGGEPVPYDIGKFDSRYFSYIASFGAFTEASYSTPQNMKNSLGHFAYLLEGTKYLPSITKPLHVKITTDTGKVFEDNYVFGAIANTTSIGGVVKFDPKMVNMSDGKFELFLVKPPADVIQITQCIDAINTKKYHKSDMITFASAREICIESDGSFPWTLDGEKQEGLKKVKVSNLHHAINIIKKK